MRCWLTPCLALVCLISPAALCAGDITALTVLPFKSLAGEHKAWLDKGIPDMLMGNLSQVDELAVLDRDKLQTYLREMELQQSAFFEQEQALRVGSIARVDQVIYGNYRLEQHKITINLILVDLATQKVLQKETVSGEFDRLHQLVDELTLDFLEHRRLSVDERELEHILSRPTDSIPATEHFYKALNYYDQGKYADAFGHFYAAVDRDPDYWESRLWMARMLEDLEMERLAIHAYKALYKNAPAKQIYRYDALMLAANLLEKDDIDEAVSLYHTISGNTPALPHSIEASYRLGKLLELKNEYLSAYTAFSDVDKYYKHDERKYRNREIQTSRFYRWHDALKLSRDAIVHMVMIYPEILALDDHEIPEPPRGAIVVDPEDPEFKEEKYGRTRPLFIEDTPLENWEEKFYAIVVPDGYVATGIDMEIRGNLTKKNNRHDFTMRVSPFPLPHNYHNTWLGVIYGQTDTPATLHKYIPFYGKHQRLLTLQFIENFSNIYHWKFRLRLEKETAPENRLSDGHTGAANGEFTEGQVVSAIELNEKAFSGITQSLAEYWYSPKHSLALVDNYSHGLHLVMVKGELNGEQTDLWSSHSIDGFNWSTPERISVNSQSEDFAPRLIRAEDGSVHLFWLSDRRGTGWEIWTSRLNPDAGRWNTPNRIPLETFADPGTLKPGTDATGLLHFAVTQDRHGRWLLVYRSPRKRKIIILKSMDAMNWKLAASIRSSLTIFNPALVEDGKGVYRLGVMGSDRTFHLWSSNNLKKWAGKSYRLNNYSHIATAAVHPAHLISESASRLLLVLSDATYGLQYARFDPDVETPRLDLVKNVGLEAYAITGYENGHYLVAERKSDTVRLRKFKRFQTRGPESNSKKSIIYSEFDNDNDGNRWRRIYARARFIQPDVTTVGIERDGRVWWGIETGIMALKGDDFFAADVTDGFFHHHVTDITSCNHQVYFISRDLDKAVLANTVRLAAGFKFRKTLIKEAKGHFTAIACGRNETLYLGTSIGEIFRLNSGKTGQIHTIPEEVITAIVQEEAKDHIWVGTADGRIYRFNGAFESIPLPVSANGPVTSIAVDNSGIVWASVKNTGVFRFLENAWQLFDGSNDDFDFLYRSIGILRKDPDEGVWMMPGYNITSPGIVFVNGKGARLYNPPGRTITAPTGLAVSPDGEVWIGTAFDGIFRLQRRH